MTREQIHLELCDILRDLYVTDRQGLLPLDTRFREDLGADSMDLVGIVGECEGFFEIQITDEEAESVRTIGQAVDLLETKLAAA